MARLYQEAAVAARLIALPAAAATLLVAAACGKPEALTPPEIHLGSDVCSRCGMMLSERRFAGALVFRHPSGDVVRRLFDDVGELLQAQVPSQEHRFYAADFRSGNWIDAEKATFVFSRSVMTPMATGVTAFGNQTEAEAFAKSHAGALHSFPEARDLATRKMLGVDAGASPP